MIWQQPWAWIGALSVALPIAIHLLGRRRPKPLEFPTLRFIGVAEVAPARRHRVTDIPLLIVRVAVLLAATAALAQPWLPALQRSTAAGIARAIVVDASPSMSRTGDDGRSMIETARARARAAATSDPRARVIESASLETGIAAAAHWLSAQAPPREIVVISDMQRGSMSETDAAAIPAGIGLRFERLNPRAAPITGARVEWPAGTFVPEVTAARESTTAAWQPDTGTGKLSAFPVIHGAPAESAAIEAALAAARTEGLPASDRLSRIDLDLPGSTNRADNAAAAPLDEPWMGGVIADVRLDPTLASLARKTTRAASPVAISSDATVLFRDATGQPLVAAQAGTKDGSGSRLRIVANVAADDVLLPALIATLARAASGDIAAWREREPETIDDVTLQGWTRQPSTTEGSTSAGSGDSDGRWLWGLALMLLGVEAWMRRSPAVTPAEVERARVA